MPTHIANGPSHPADLSFWLRVREYAVPPAMIETATTRRHAGDWAGACAAAGVDVDLDLRSVSRVHGRERAARIRADLRALAPDLLRWHMPRIAPDGLLRPGLTIALARYDAPTPDGPPPLYLVARTPPAWADAGQRISLALWDGSTEPAPRLHPHPHPSRRHRLDLHRHLWDAHRSAELRPRSACALPAQGDPYPYPYEHGTHPEHRAPAVHQWAAEARILLRAEGRPAGPVVVRLDSRRRLLLDVSPEGAPACPPPRITTVPLRDTHRGLPLLPDAAVWVPPDVELLRAGLLGPDRLHPLVAAALVPGHVPAGPPVTTEPPGGPRFVDCRGARHRIALVDGVLVALDHDPREIHREELLVALTGTPLPCLRAIDEAHRHPDCLSGVRERLDHGDVAGALAVVEGLLGPDAVLRGGALRDELEAAARRRIDHGLYRAGLAGPGPGPGPGPRPGPHPVQQRVSARRRRRRRHRRRATVR
ncbi:hypothetical protein [Streptomyces sp. RerS4]|uniref:hypothetical protein n=1 Tax=Streptomyces sp. RerS4 TaxID=2942449 RepID=UPI00201BB34E|nr:hypothetical protein [Streptomyces sp. RerS4]UQW99550.1 hypothetical protein M4D82_02630 [Streptomyces sp. RerS4]